MLLFYEQASHALENGSKVAVRVNLSEFTLKKTWLFIVLYNIVCINIRKDNSCYCIAFIVKDI